MIRLVEEAIRNVGEIPRDRLYVLVRDVQITGSPPRQIAAAVVVRFLPAGAPFCCGEPLCYSSAFTEQGHEEIGEYLRRKMGLRHALVFKCDTTVEYYDGIEFTAYPHSSPARRVP